MKNSGQILRVGFWVLLFVAFVIGWWKLGGKANHIHLNYLPAQSSMVVTVDAHRMSETIIELIKEDPELLEDILPSEPIEINKEIISFGVDPYADLVFFGMRAEDDLALGTIVKGNGMQLMRSFDKHLGEHWESAYSSEDGSVQIKKSKATDQDVLYGFNKEVFIGLIPLKKNFSQASAPLYLTQLQEALEHPENGLMASKPEVKSKLEQDKDILLWTSGNRNDKLFGDRVVGTFTQFSFVEGVMDFETEYSFSSKEIFQSPVVSGLKKGIPASFGIQLHRSLANRFVSETIPPNLRSFFTGFDGRFCFEILGTQMIQGYHIETQFDEEAVEQEIRVPNKRKDPFPEFIGAIGIDTINLAQWPVTDTLTFEGESLYSYEIFSGATIYMTFNKSGKELVFGTDASMVAERKSTDLSAEFSTWNMHLDFIETGRSVPKGFNAGMLNGTMLAIALQMLEFERLDFELLEFNETTATAKGTLLFKDAEVHSMVSLLKMVRQAFDNRDLFLMLLHGIRDANSV